MVIAIIGAGIAGASVAYHLSLRTDEEIIVFDRQSPASETTAKSVGQFGFYGDETQYKMKEYGMKLYNEFFADPQANPAYSLAGRLDVALTEEGDAELQESVQSGGIPRYGKTIGTGIERDLVQYISGSNLENSLMHPYINGEQIEGAVYRPKVGYMTRPHELAHEFIERAQDNGVTFHYNTSVTDIRTKGNQVTCIVTGEGQEMDVETVVCAAGPWNIHLASKVGLQIPISHTLAPVLQLEPSSPLEVTVPAVSHYESPYTIHRRTDTELLLGYHPDSEEATEYDPDATSESVPSEVRNGMIETVREISPNLLDATLVNEWVGIRSQTPDGNPVIGWTDVEGFLLVAFHTSGIQLAPKAGEIIASLVIDGSKSRLSEKLSIARFQGDSHHRE